jgi:hypothetical protein
MDVQHARRCELGFILARVNAVDRADVDAGGIFGANAWIGDDESHSVELTQKATGL